MIPKTTLAAVTVERALEECAISLEFYANSGSPFLMSERFCQLFLLRLQGDGQNSTSLSTDEIDENTWLALWQQPETLFGHGLAYFLNFKLQLLYLFGQWREAWDFANAHADWMQYIPILYETTVFTFYRALAGASIYEQADVAEQEVIARTLDAAIADFTLWTTNCPDNYAWQEQLLRAEQAQISQRPKDALTGYGQAAALARQYHRSAGQALNQERAGRLQLHLGQRQRAKSELEEAVFHYYQWGAIGKAQALNQEFEGLLPSATLTRPTGTLSSYQGTISISTDRLDLNTVLKASLALSGEILIDSLLQKLMTIFIENAGAEQGYLLIPSMEDTEHWMIVAQASVLDQQARLERIPMETASTVCEAVVRYVIRTRQSLTLDDALQDDAFGNDPYVHRQRVRSVLCLPLLAQNQLKAVLYLENNKLTGAFLAGRVEILNMLAAQAAIAIENAQLYENLERQVAERTRELSEANRRLQQLSDCDGLTGIANRRKFDAVWEVEWQRAARQALPVAIAMIDVDHFKAFNDHYGHQAGDVCLQQVAQALAATAQRSSDLVARYGGEEFVVVLPNLSAQQSLHIAERLRAAVEDLGIAHVGNSAAPVVTISIGVAWRTPGLNDPSSELLAEADALLYQAKNQGRNRVASRP
jgi:diguanylate cyclase (GGDEF)-like protein